MKKIVIEGMKCQHCAAHATEALNKLPGVTATVDLDAKTATIEGEATNEALTAAVEGAGYKVVSID